ncbi:unnamed protein product [Alopecurus aequalis]
MAPKKLILRYIENGPTRKETGKKRTMSLVKKAGELSILCGIDVVLIVVPEGESSQPVVYPSPRPEMLRILDRFNSLPELERLSKRMDGEGYARRERIGKIQDQLRKAEHENRQRETMLLLHNFMIGRRRNLEGLAVQQLISVGWTADNLVKTIKDRIADHSGLQQASVTADPPPYAATVAKVEAPQVQHGCVMEVLDAGADVSQLGNVEAEFTCAFPCTY